MKIFVMVKQVPDTEAKIKVLPDKSGIDEAGLKWVVNPYDEYAIEEAIKIKEKNSAASVNLISVGPKARVVESLRTGLAMGADEAIVIDAPNQLDNYLTAKALAETIRKEGGAELILAGKLAIDDNAWSVPQQVAQFLQLPHVSVISKLEIKDGAVVVERDSDGGTKEVVEVKRPVVLSANKGLNMPRYASLPGIMKAKKKAIKEVALADLGLNAGSMKAKYQDFQMPPDRPPAVMLDGDFNAQVQKLVDLLRNQAKVI